MGRPRKQIDFALKFWWLTHLAKRIGGKTPFKHAASLIASEKAFSGSYVPVGESIEIPPSVVAPKDILQDLIRRASARTIIRFCPCRVGEGCENYPRDFGCLLLGDGARDVHPDVGHEASCEEALAHLDRAIEMGLLPLVGHLKIDQVVFGVRDYARLLTMCFCCRCCCVLLSEMRSLVEAFPRSLVRLEGVMVDVTGDCTGCGVCLAACPIENITLENGVAVIGEKCIGCGSCASVCPNSSITVKIEPGSKILEDIRCRIEKGVDIET